jgi:ATP-dependent Clp protease ATP-binding subunit ClpA
VIQEHVKRPLAEELLFGKLSNGGQALVTLAADGSGLAIEYVPAPEPEVHA